MKKLWLRVPIIVVLGALLTGSLTACDQFLPEPLSFTRVGSAPVVRACLPMGIRSIQIKTYEAEEDYTGRVVWLASSSGASSHVSAGTEFELGVPLDGLDVVTDEGADFMTGQFAVEMRVSTLSGGAWTTFSYLDGEQLTEDEWVDSYGDTQAAPCTHEDCSRFAACFNNWPEPTGAPTLPEATFLPTPRPSSEP